MERAKLNYVEEVSDKKLIESAINGMLTSLDPHSSYLDADSFNYMSEQTKGKFGGLGIEVTMDNGLVKVVSPIDDTPAAKAGIKAGDYITNINGETVVGMSLNDAVSKMRGKVGEKVKLSIRRVNSKPIELTIKTLLFTSEFLRLRKMLTNLSAKQLPKQKRNLKTNCWALSLTSETIPAGC